MGRNIIVFVGQSLFSQSVSQSVSKYGTRPISTLAGNLSVVERKKY